MNEAKGVQHLDLTSPRRRLKILGVVVLATTAFALAAFAQQFYNKWSPYHGTNDGGILWRYQINGPNLGMVQVQNNYRKAVTIDYVVTIPQKKQQTGTIYINSESNSSINNITTTNSTPPSDATVQVK
jgi:hypothetical protein